jgi:hypothetical protein
MTRLDGINLNGGGVIVRFEVRLLDLRIIACFLRYLGAGPGGLRAGCHLGLAGSGS